MDSLNWPCSSAAIILLLLSVLPASSQAALKKTPPWYDVEIVLFSVADRGSSEQWPIDPGKPEAEGTVTISSFKQLPSSDWKLAAEDAALNRSKGRYRTLAHLAWRQPVLSRMRAKPIYIRSQKILADGFPALEGSIRISVGRYLHVNLDLLLRDRIQTASIDTADFQAYRFIAHRRMRSGETHYIDHPRIGALVRIEKAPQADTPMQEDPADPVNGE